MGGDTKGMWPETLSTATPQFSKLTTFQPVQCLPSVCWKDMSMVSSHQSNPQVMTLELSLMAELSSLMLTLFPDKISWTAMLTNNYYYAKLWLSFLISMTSYIGTLLH